jgi:hypothetical protein
MAMKARWAEEPVSAASEGGYKLICFGERQPAIRAGHSPLAGPVFNSKFGQRLAT